MITLQNDQNDPIPSQIPEHDTATGGFGSETEMSTSDMEKNRNKRDPRKKDRRQRDRTDSTDMSSESGSASDGSRKRERDNEGFKQPLPKREVDVERILKKAVIKLKEKERKEADKIAELEKRLRQKRENSRDSAMQS